MLLMPDHFYLSPRSLQPARLIPFFPQPTAVHISQSPQRRRLREDRAELGDVTEPYPVLLWPKQTGQSRSHSISRVPPANIFSSFFRFQSNPKIKGSSHKKKI